MVRAVDYLGWRGGAWISPADAEGESTSFGEWDSVEVRAYPNCFFCCRVRLISQYISAD